MSAPDDEWGPWIEHDGRGCPVPKGTWVRSVTQSGSDRVHRALCVNESSTTNAWDWSQSLDPIIRYRVRRPRALLQLRALAADPPPLAPERVREDA